MAEYAAVDNLPGRNRSCNALALPARTQHHEVCACSWPGAARLSSSDSHWLARSPPNRDRFAQGMDI